MIAESFAPGASVAEVARRYGVNANLLFTWRRRAASGANHVGRLVDIVPVRVVREAAPLAPAVPTGSIGRMEILLIGGERVIVGPDVDATALARIVKALSRLGRAGLA